MRPWSDEKKEAHRHILMGLVGEDMEINILCDGVYRGRIVEFIGDNKVKIYLREIIREGNLECPIRWIPYTSAIFIHPAIRAFYKLYE